MKSKIIFEDNDILVIYKPAGIATQAAGSFSMDVESELKNYLKNSKAELYIIHRLDQPVEGLLVFAKTKAAASSLNKQLQNQDLKKSYLAVVFMNQMDTWTANHEILTLKDYIKKDAKSKLSVVSDKNDPDAKEAILQYKVLNSNEEFGIALVEINLKTGRFHQIRCQFSNMNAPLLGDQKYGNEKSNQISKENQIRYVALCANTLSFIHPKTGKEMEFQIEAENKAFSLINF